MSCRAIAVLALYCGCTVDDVPVIEVTATATREVTVGPAEQEPLPERASFRWDLVLAPPASNSADPHGQGVASFLPDRRGIYVIERWLAFGLSDALTHRFIVVAQGFPPTAHAVGETDVAVGSTVTLDGSASSSSEGLSLTYKWRLTERPQGSTAAPTETSAIITSLVPDRAGDYNVELTVFDGELWSNGPARLWVRAY